MSRVKIPKGGKSKVQFVSGNSKLKFCINLIEMSYVPQEQLKKSTRRPSKQINIMINEHLLTPKENEKSMIDIQEQPSESES